jgi:hypothetical protein
MAGRGSSGVRVWRSSALTRISAKQCGAQSEIIIDSQRSRTQALAMIERTERKIRCVAGQRCRSAQRADHFRTQWPHVRSVTNEAAINVEGMPNDLCCKMPNLVWYTPLVGLENRKSATHRRRSTPASRRRAWSRSGENSAFYGPSLL